MNQYQVLSIETDRLLLRAHTLEDSQSYQKHFATYSVISNMAKNVPWPYPEDGAYNYLKNFILPEQGLTRWDWAITLKENPSEVIGSVGLWKEALPGNRGFWLSEKYWNMGLMSEATAPIIDFAFNELNFKILTNAAENKGSRRVKEKSGAVLVSLSTVDYNNPEYSDSEIWVLTKKAWFSKIS